MLDTVEIQEKEKKLQEVKETLKSEFIGIDEIIDNIIDNARSWYLFPWSIRKPIIINLWGMTGCGKTSLVRRFCELLDLGNSMIYYNLAKLTEDTSTKIEDTIFDFMAPQSMNSVFILDEFQYAATIDLEGHETNNKSGLKTIWELIDTGKFHAHIAKHKLSHLSALAFCADVLSSKNAKIVDGVWVNAEEVFQSESVGEMGYTISRYFNFKDKTYVTQESTWSDMLDGHFENDLDKWLTSVSLALIYDIYVAMTGDKMSRSAFSNKMYAMNIEQLIDFIDKLINKSKAGFYLDYSNSLIFVIGNIDEAYKINHDMNPDMDADLFNEKTKKLTVLDIKKGLQRRFRDEQISRLGNTMLIYPAFSIDSFNKIIKHYLNKTVENAKKDFDIDLNYDDSIVQMIYNEGVFPSQGVRPIVSSIYELIDSKLSMIITKEYDKGVFDIKSINLSFNDNNLYADILYGDSKTDSISLYQPLRTDDTRKNRNNESQAVTALHESGHFVMYAKLFGKMPKKLVSNCVSHSMNGFMIPPPDEDTFVSKDDYMRNIKVDIAGYVAESLIFGENNLTSGSANDIENATTTASQMLREFGMRRNGSPCSYTYLKDPISTNRGMLLLSDNDKISNEVKDIIRVCWDDVINTFKDDDWRKMLAQSSEYLFNHTSMPNEVMEEIYNSVPEEKRNAELRSETYYRDRLNNLIDTTQKTESYPQEYYNDKLKELINKSK